MAKARVAVGSVPAYDIDDTVRGGFFWPQRKRRNTRIWDVGDNDAWGDIECPNNASVAGSQQARSGEDREFGAQSAGGTDIPAAHPPLRA